jgi:hypothetical protein
VSIAKDYIFNRHHQYVILEEVALRHTSALSQLVCGLDLMVLDYFSVSKMEEQPIFLYHILEDSQ